MWEARTELRTDSCYRWMEGWLWECISTSSKRLVRLQTLNNVVHVTPTSLVCVPPFSGPPPFSCLQSFPASGSFLKSQLFASGGQSIGASASASVGYYCSAKGLTYNVLVLTQLYLTLCDPMDCSPPDSSVHEIFQARILEWIAIFFSRGSS